MKWIIPEIIIVAFVCYLDAQLESCYAGTYKTRHWTGFEICEPCPDGLYMPHHDHNLTECYPCSQLKDPNIEIIVEPCTIYRNATIMCKEGYYRRRAPNRDSKDECVACTPCEYPALKCFNYTDSVCCLTKNYEAVHSFGDVYICDERPCGPGQRFDEKADHCVPCPKGTYMPQDVHKHFSCLNCQVLNHNMSYHSRLFRECTRESPTLFGCMPGFYRDLGSPMIETKCTACTKCQCNTIRRCSDYHDTICDSCNRSQISSSVLSHIPSSEMSHSSPSTLYVEINHISPINSSNHNCSSNCSYVEKAEQHMLAIICVLVGVIVLSGISTGCLIYIEIKTCKARRQIKKSVANV